MWHYITSLHPGRSYLIIGKFTYLLRNPKSLVLYMFKHQLDWKTRRGQTKGNLFYPWLGVGKIPQAVKPHLITKTLGSFSFFKRMPRHLLLWLENNRCFIGQSVSAMMVTKLNQTAGINTE